MITKRSALMVLLFFLPATAFAAKRYVVKQGDNLSTLAKRFRVSLLSIKKISGLSSDRLNVGDTLLVPDPENDKASANQTVDSGQMVQQVQGASIVKEFSQNQVTSIRQYTVVQGDTLSGIGKKFGVSPRDIIRQNNLRNTKLQIGQRLNIPSISKSNKIVASYLGISNGTGRSVESQRASPYNRPHEYFVKSGDTLSSIGKRFGVSVRSLKNTNGLRSDRLSIGARLIIPDVSSINSKAQVVQENEIVPLNVNETTRYVVKRGDTLARIARRFNVSIRDLKYVNHIGENTLRVGQAISIPTQTKVVRLSADDINMRRDQDKAGIKSLLEDKTDDHHGNGDNSGSISRDSIIKIAKRFLGVPYKFGGTSLIKGLDCSAFVAKVFSFLNVDLPRTARELFGVGRRVERSQLAAGDLVFFRTYASYPSHVGIYMGDSEFIHASSKAHMVTIDNMNRPYFIKRYIGARRIENAGLFYEELSHDYKGFERQ